MRRINRAADKEPMIESLTKGDKAPFKDMCRLLIFAAALGFKHGRKETLVAVEASKAIRHTEFNDPNFLGMLNLMTLLTKKDPKLLTATDENDNQKIRLFEEYANGGLAIMHDKLHTSSYSLDSVVSFLAGEIHENSGADIDLSGVQI